MPRFRNPRSGVVVSVDDATATRLGRAYEPAEDAAAKKAPTKRSSAKKASSKAEPKSDK